MGQKNLIMRSYILLISSIAVGVRGLGVTNKFTCGSHEYTVTASELVDWSYCKVYCSERNLVWAEAHNMEEWQCVKKELMLNMLIDKTNPKPAWTSGWPGTKVLMVRSTGCLVRRRIRIWIKWFSKCPASLTAATLSMSKRMDNTGTWRMRPGTPTTPASATKNTTITENMRKEKSTQYLAEVIEPYHVILI